MSSPITLSVNGLPGIDQALEREAHLVEATPNASLALTGNGETGAHGVNAPAALAGDAAGVLAVELSESSITQGGIRVSVVGQEPANSLPKFTEVLPHGSIILSAKGGDGEQGRQGGDGRPGMPGTAGTAATEILEATNGNIGGRGGDAGRGSNGGGGGPGGTVQIRVGADALHLLLASSWDVSGGAGGEPGRHGRPGPGGPGGPGGSAHIWEKQIDWKYRCSANCVGKMTTTMVLRERNDPTMNMIRNVGARAQMGQGSFALTAVARVAQLYHKPPTSDANIGVCICKGGPAHCPGCEATPIYRTFSKQRGVDGEQGPEGHYPPESPSRGARGPPGHGVIIVRQPDGQSSRYDRCYDLHLVSFDLEDEGADGIFEPGEHILVRRITLKNIGGMPTPSCQLPCAFEDVNMLIPTENENRYAYLPTSIPAGHSATSDDFAKALIFSPTIDPRSRGRYVRTLPISLQATMPWLDQRLENFALVKDITVKYPLELRETKGLGTVAHGTLTEISYQVYNEGNIPFGTGYGQERQARVRVSMDPDDGRLRSPDEGWMPSLDIIVPPVKAKDFTILRQTLQIGINARPYKKVKVTLALYISPASLVEVPDDLDISRMQLIQSQDFTMQVAPGYIHDDTAEVLLVTNVDTKLNQFDAMRHFIEKELFLKMSVWNVSLYGRLFTDDSSNAEESENILSLYRGKAIIFLGNTFSFHGTEISSLQLCDSTSLFEASATGTSCLFLGSIGDRQIFENLVLPSSGLMSGVLSSLPVTSRFATLTQLLRALAEESRTSESCYEISIPRRRYLTRSYNVSLSATRTTKTLRNEFPQDRFRICPISSTSQPRTEVDGNLLIHRGLTQSSSITATECSFLREKHQQTALRLPGAPGTQFLITNDHRPLGLDSVDKYTIASALTLVQRVDLLWSTSDNAETPTPDDVLNLVVLSAQQSLDAEIQSFLDHSSWPNSIKLDSSNAKSLSVHLPGVAAILEHPCAQDRETACTPEIIRLLLGTLASCQPQKKREIAASVCIPVGRRRAHLRRTLNSLYRTLLTSKGFGKDDLRNFSSELSKLHSNFESGKRHTESVLKKAVKDATGKSTHYLTVGRLGVGDLVPESRVWTVEEWDRRYRARQRHNEELSQHMQQAWDENYKLILGTESRSLPSR